MAFEIVDGMTGTKHISSDDLSALNVATIGKADCVLKYGDDFKLTMASANSATLGTGVGMVGGKRFWNQAATSLTVQSGTQGQKRNDLVVARYAKTSDGIESITPVVIKGTPTTGTAADPDVTANDLKLWRVPLDGISVGEPVKLFEPVASLATLGDSVSHTVLYKNTKGTTTNFVLSEAVTDFEYVDIYYKSGVVRMYPADYVTVALSANSFNEDWSLDVEGAYLSFSGKAATFTNANHKLFYESNGYAKFDHYSEVHQHLAVVLVLGYK